LVRGGTVSLAAAHEAVAFAAANSGAWDEDTHKLRLIFERSEIRLLPAIVPGKMVCAGRNYRAHQVEMGTPTFDDFPRGFIKVSSTLQPDDADIVFPHHTKELDYEVELAAVIGKRGRDIDPDDALDHVYGYTIFNDLSARDWQYAESKNGNHLLGKNLDGLGPLGPAIVPKEFVADPMNLPLRLTVNGTVRQDATTATMIWNLAQLIAHWSRMTLEVGDVIATGTPEGTAYGLRPRDPAAYLKPGDRIEAEIGGIGVLRTRLVQ
jgi:2-keto-4-pentenoate hydratase/2-oxohepta-3-ene-1,7-dioic acid hydratase in catechol pathway